MPYSLDLPQADRDIWLKYDDLISSAYATCEKIFAKADEHTVVKEQIAAARADFYLRSLMNLDTEARRWIGKIVAGAV